ncbi:Universal stress protein A-like protein [Senna tora]|uniref:Universal stress protein A-like protein n=1 Tax=Senna tora TaxID=362788 RepID=A0A834TIC0_9FABA|nr:Universal stress protein A-like protein [Senna tora]
MMMKQKKGKYPRGAFLREKLMIMSGSAEMALDVLCAIVADTPKESPLDNTIAMASNNKHICSQLVCHLTDNISGVSILHLRLHLNLFPFPDYH